jgi:hypothetical protein
MPAKHTPIVAFYSVKGGVGRSLTMANVAYQMARQGHKVLCLDWDLEAPGLEFIRGVQCPDEAHFPKYGAMDVFWFRKELESQIDEINGVSKEQFSGERAYSKEVEGKLAGCFLQIDEIRIKWESEYKTAFKKAERVFKYLSDSGRFNPDDFIRIVDEIISIKDQFSIPDATHDLKSIRKDLESILIETEATSANGEENSSAGAVKQRGGASPNLPANLKKKLSRNEIAFHIIKDWSYQVEIGDGSGQGFLRIMASGAREFSGKFRDGYFSHLLMIHEQLKSFPDEEKVDKVKVDDPRKKKLWRSSDGHDRALRTRDKFIERLDYYCEKIGADVVLMDSRTGWSEAGVFCLYDLADLVTFVLCSNIQGRRGTMEVLHEIYRIRLKLEPQRELKWCWIASMLPNIPENGDALSEEYRKKLQSKVEASIKATCNVLVDPPIADLEKAEHTGGMPVAQQPVGKLYYLPILSIEEWILDKSGNTLSNPVAKSLQLEYISIAGKIWKMLFPPQPL